MDGSAYRKICRGAILMPISVFDKICAILHKTHDGDDLHESDLKLVEMASNGHLNELGIGEIDTLHQLVDDGTYKASERWLE